MRDCSNPRGREQRIAATIAWLEEGDFTEGDPMDWCRRRYADVPLLVRDTGRATGEAFSIAPHRAYDVNLPATAYDTARHKAFHVGDGSFIERMSSDSAFETPLSLVRARKWNAAAVRLVHGDWDFWEGGSIWTLRRADQMMLLAQSLISLPETMRHLVQEGGVLAVAELPDEWARELGPLAWDVTAPFTLEHVANRYIDWHEHQIAVQRHRGMDA